VHSVPGYVFEVSPCTRLSFQDALCTRISFSGHRNTIQIQPHFWHIWNHCGSVERPQRRTAWGIQGGKDSHRPPALRATTHEKDVRPFQGWLPTGCRGVGHGIHSDTLGRPRPPPCHTLWKKSFRTGVIHKTVTLFGKMDMKSFDRRKENLARNTFQKFQLQASECKLSLNKQSHSGKKTLSGTLRVRQ
jgi:hypothetical protein